MMWAFAAVCMLAQAVAMGLYLLAVWLELWAVDGVSPERPAGIPGRAALFFLPDGEIWDLESRKEDGE